MADSKPTAQTDDTVAAGGYDTKYTSTTRGINGGYLYVAPYGTTVPTDHSTKLDAAFKNAGYIGEDGFTEAVDGDSEDYKDMNGTVVDSSSAGKTETLVMKLLSIDAIALGIQYGSKNVTEDATKGITVRHNWSESDETISVVLELQLKNYRHWRKVIPACKVSEIGEFTGSSTELAGREVTLKYMDDGTGTGCYDYFEPAK